MSPATSTRPVATAGARQRVRYRFDNAMSRGPGVIILWLAGVTIGIVFLVAVTLTIFQVGINGDSDPSLVERFWQTFLRILDPGTFSGDNGWGLRVAMLLVTLLGVLIGGSLIGLIVAAVDHRVERLRRGRSFVVEQGHTLILGWSPRVFTLVSELVTANENQRGSCIVVLAGEEKPDMEEALRSRVHSMKGAKNTEIVCRTGEPSSPSDLHMVNVRAARSVIALASGQDPGAGDAEAVKAVLAVLSTDPDQAAGRIVAELNDPEIARALREASGNKVITVRASEVISRITAQACRQSGLSTVWRDLLDFDGDEIYVHPVPELVGHSFGEALHVFATSSVIGRMGADGAITVNPDNDVVFADGDSVIAISEDDDTITFGGFVDQEASDADRSPAPGGAVQRLLVVGWSSIGPVVLRELNQFVAAGSTVQVLVDTALVAPDLLDDLQLERMIVTFEKEEGDLDDIGRQAAQHVYDKVIVLGYRHGVAPAEADALSLLTLILLQRSLLPTADGTRPRIVTELLDGRDVELAMATGADDFVVSDELSSLMMAQLAERPELEKVFDDLFDVDGSVIDLRPARWYVPEGEVPYRRIVAAARDRNEVAIGYRRTGGAKPETVLNPDKSTIVHLDDDDQVVVIAPA